MIPMWGSPPVLGGLGALGGNGFCYIKLGPCGSNSTLGKLGGPKVSRAERRVLLPSTRAQRALDPSLRRGQVVSSALPLPPRLRPSAGLGGGGNGPGHSTPSGRVFKVDLQFTKHNKHGLPPAAHGQSNTRAVRVSSRHPNI